MTTSSHALDELITTPQQDHALLNIFRYPLTIIAAPDGYRKVSILSTVLSSSGFAFSGARNPARAFGGSLSLPLASSLPLLPERCQNFSIRTLLRLVPRLSVFWKGYAGTGTS